MIRPFTALCVLLAGSSGLYLYTEKHRTTVLDQQISKIVDDTQHIRERTAMLRAEWALLNQPDRLHSLSTRFLPNLQPMMPSQFVQMSALAQRLPAIAAPIAVANPLAAIVTPASVAAAAAPLPLLAEQVVPAAGEAMAERPAPVKRRLPELPVQLVGAGIVGELAHHAVAQIDPSARRARGSLTLASLSHPAVAHPFQQRPAAPRTMSASRMIAYEGSPVRSLISTAGPYARSSSMQTAAWQPMNHSGYALARRSAGARAGGMQQAGLAPAAGTGSMLGFSHAAMAAPVPLVGD